MRKIDPTLERSLQKVKSHFVWHLDMLEMQLSSSDLNQESTRSLSGSTKISNIIWKYWLSVNDFILEWAVFIYPNLIT